MSGFAELVLAMSKAAHYEGNSKERDEISHRLGLLIQIIPTGAEEDFLVIAMGEVFKNLHGCMRECTQNNTADSLRVFEQTLTWAEVIFVRIQGLSRPEIELYREGLKFAEGFLHAKRAEMLISGLQGEAGAPADDKAPADEDEALATDDEAPADEDDWDDEAVAPCYDKDWDDDYEAVAHRYGNDWDDNYWDDKDKAGADDEALADDQCEAPEDERLRTRCRRCQPGVHHCYHLGLDLVVCESCRYCPSREDPPIRGDPERIVGPWTCDTCLGGGGLDYLCVVCGAYPPPELHLEEADLPWTCEECRERAETQVRFRTPCEYCREGAERCTHFGELMEVVKCRVCGEGPRDFPPEGRPEIVVGPWTCERCT